MHKSDRACQIRGLVVLFAVLLSVLLIAGSALAPMVRAAAQAEFPVDLKAFSGEFTNPADPDTPYSFYVQPHDYRPATISIYPAFPF